MGLWGGGGRAKLRKRVQRDLATPTWQMLALGKDWICPFCGVVAIKGLPPAGDARIDAVLDHLDGPCPDFQGGEGQERPGGELKRVQLRRELRHKVKKALRQQKSWQLVDAKQCWYCPYCGDGTGIQVPVDRRMTDEVLEEIVAHVDRCFAYEHGRGEEKPYKQLKAQVKQANQTRKLVETVRSKLEGDPAWRRKDGRGTWVCPYCLKSQEHIDLSSNLLMFENAPRQIALHLTANCPSYKSGAAPKPLGSPSREGREASASGSQSAPLGPGTDSGLLASLLDSTSDGQDDLGLSNPPPPQRAGSATGRTGTAPTAPPPPQRGATPTGWGPSDPEPPPLPTVKEVPPAAASRSTTLRQLRSSGEYVRVDEAEVASSGGQTGGRGLDDWRREIERELASVRQLAPGLSGEIMTSSAVLEGGADELADLAARVGLERFGMELGRVHLPASQPRGDWSEVLELSAERLGLVAGGVVGDEPDAPLLAAVARSQLRQRATPNRCPGEIVREVNAELFGDLDGRNFLTVVYAVLDLPTWRLRLVRAGQVPPLLRNPVRGLTSLGTEGMALGIDKGPVFNTSLEVKTYQLSPGDLLVLYNNSIHEARAPGREEFGEERMRGLVQRYGGHEVAYFCDKFREHFEAYHGGPERRSRDATLVALLRRTEG